MLQRSNPAAWAQKQAKLKKAKDEVAVFKEPPMIGIGIRLFRGVKFEIKNIHIRYEDDFFAANSPFSFGFTIEKISLDNSEQEEQAQNAFIKLFEIKNMSVYWNSLSEMFIPTSVYDMSLGDEFKYGIFEFIEANIIHDMMKDMFNNKIGMQNSYLIDPFSSRIQIAMRTSYD